MNQTPKLIRGPLKKVRSRVFDGARWNGYRPRADDIIIATYPKCGTTWTQRIVCMLVRQSAEPVDIIANGPWPDMRLFEPVAEGHAKAEAMTHRRFYKSHLPYDALPIYEGVKFIHVARDGRDAAMSFHNHLSNSLPPDLEKTHPEIIADLANDPKFGAVFPQPPSPDDPRGFFRDWVRDGEYQNNGDPHVGFFYMEQSYWAARAEPDMLLVHYNDLKEDRAGEMRRIADFLEIEIPARLWPELIDAAGFARMKAEGDALLPSLHGVFDKGPQRFLHQGTNGRWRGVVDEADLALYEQRVRAEFPPDLARWLERGRLGAGDPKEM